MLQHFETRAEKASLVGLVALLAVVIIVALASVATQIGLPSPGFVVWHNLVVPAIGAPGWPGSRADVPLRAVVEQVDGQSVHRAEELRAIVRAAPPGAVINYTFRHDQQLVTIGVPTAKLRWRDVAPIYAPYLIAGVGFYGVALVVFYFRPGLAA